jgi:uncharacterized membrane-anchored protein
MRIALFVAFAVLNLGVVNGLIVGKERLLREGQVVFLRLVPRDPRSLIQGDYMALNYDMADAASRGLRMARPHKGCVVVKLDERNVGSFVRFHRGEALGPGELLLVYRRAKWGRIGVGPRSFFFQEGHARTYARAKYGELRVSPAGECVLVGLRGEGLEPLGP